MRRYSKLATAFLIALGLFGFASCKNESGTSAERSAEKPTTDISISVASVSEFEESVKSHTGKVVVVDMWAIW